MKKKYIFLLTNVTNIGGSQLYSKNKKIFLEEKGWEVDIFSFQDGEIVVPELKQYDKLIIKDLKHPPYLYSNFKKNLILEKICETCFGYDEVIVESQTVNLSIWGELIAEKVQGKHLVFLLTESFGNLSSTKLSFLDFKHQRKELASISDKSLEILFKNYKEVGVEERYKLKATGSNVVEDINDEKINKIQKKEINIGCISRLEKSYLSPLVDEIINLADMHPNTSFQLILVGGTHYNQVISNLKRKVKNTSNLNLIITGFLFPIPRSLFDKTDLFVGVSGGARIPHREGLLTISLDHRTAQPIGILGFETQNALYADPSSLLTLKDKLEEVIFEKNLLGVKTLTRNKFKEIDFRTDYEPHISFIDAFSSKRVYFNVKKVKATKEEIIKKLLSLMPFQSTQKKLSYWNVVFKKELKNLREK